MNKTNKYYKTNAQSFFEETIFLNMDSLYEKFENYLKPKSLIVDAGAGSGRDSLYFQSKGYSLYSFDSNSEFCQIAKEKLNLKINCHDFLDFPNNIHPDAIWACASLLHLDKKKLKSVLVRYQEILKPNGLFYMSFKYGTFEGERSGRYFTDLTETSLSAMLTGLELKPIELWKTADTRSDRKNEFWLNAILKK